LSLQLFNNLTFFIAIKFKSTDRPCVIKINTKIKGSKFNIDVEDNGLGTKLDRETLIKYLDYTNGITHMLVERVWVYYLLNYKQKI